MDYKRLVFRALSFLLCLLVFFRDGISSETDSLKNLLYAEKKDTVQIELFIKIALAQSSSDSSIYYTRKAIQIARIKGHEVKLANALNTAAYYYENTGKYNEELAALKEALMIFEKLNRKRGLSATYGKLGSLYTVLGNYKLANEYYLKGIQLDHELKDSVAMAEKTANLGNIFYLKDDDKNAIEYYKKAILLFTQVGDNKEKISVLGNLGAVYQRAGDLENAASIYNQVINETVKNGDKGSLLYATYNLAIIYKNLKNYSKSKLYYNITVKLCLEVGDIYVESLAQEELGIIYHNLKMFDSSLFAFRSSIMLKDSFERVTNKRQMNELTVQFDTEKKEKQIEIQKLSLEKQESELKKRQVVIYSIVGGLVLVVLLGINIYRNLQKNKRKNNIISAQKLEVERQKHIIEEKHKEITDSIKYAKRLQEAIMPPIQLVREMLPDSFILFRPKDMVSGDFYWVEETEDRVYFAAADCTGHGVPGAFMSIVNYNLLKHAINEHGRTVPSDILMQVNKDLSASLRQEYHESTIKDGMDVALCCYDKRKETLEYAGANNSIYIVEDGLLREIKADKQPIGTFVGEEFKPFTNHNLSVKSGTMIFLFTDGYADQFGGPKGKKFMYKRFEELLRNNAHLPLEEQKLTYAKTIDEWKRDNEQVDDILLIGVRIHKAG